MEEEQIFTLDNYHVHASAHASLKGELTVTTTDAPWAYAVSFPPRSVGQRQGAWLFTIVVDVERGQIGVGILRPDGSSFVRETLVRGRATVNLRVSGDEALGPLVIRNAGSTESAAVRLLSISSHWDGRSAHPYLVNLSPRQMSTERRPENGGIGIFDDEQAATINLARMEWLSRLALDVSGKRVLDAGAGVGHFSRYYAERGATVVALEGRAENVAVFKQRHPGIDAHTIDVQADDFGWLGAFDIVHCFGLLYHLDSPVIALRRLQGVCQEVLLLETMVCDSARAVMVLADETYTVNQALAGVGCRPSPTFVALALNRVGFSYVYGAQEPPDHPDFRFEWRNNMDAVRDGGNLRCVFVASRQALTNPALTPLF